MLRARGAEPESVLVELLRYTESPYLKVPSGSQEFDGNSDTFWLEFVSGLEACDVLGCLEEVMPQLRFPVAEGMRSDPEYREATLKGGQQGVRGGLELKYPSEFRLVLHDAGFGSVPALMPKGREDFRALVQAIMGRNEPIEVPDSMGACVVAGYNNWGRIHRMKSQFLVDHPFESWAQRFAEIRKSPELYTDQFFIISDGPYSGVSSSALDLAEDSWCELSSQIRLHHESFHLFCRRFHGTMQSNALDETFADFMGLIQSLGTFDQSWFYLFMGLEREQYREGGRLQNYCQQLSKPAFEIVCRLTRDAGRNLSGVSSRLKDVPVRDKMKFLLRHDLLDLAEGRFHWETD
jgi:uncharacterized protein DUF7005